MKNWTLINEFEDRIERIVSKIFINKGMKTQFSYWTFIDDKRHYGHLNKIKKIINDYRKTKCKWEEVWE